MRNQDDDPANFINAIPLHGASQPSQSEIKCGHVLAALVPRKWVVVLKEPSGHRGKGATGDTGDYSVYQGGVGSTLLTIMEDETRWGTVDAYTPESSDPDQVLKKVANKLDTQAKAVIVDLDVARSEKDRDAIVKKIATVLGESGRTVILHHKGKNRVINPKSPFLGDPDTFV